MQSVVQVSDGVDAEVVRPTPVRYNKPRVVRGGVIIACPHSGRFYPPELLNAAALDHFTLRRSEDAFVDLLFQDAPHQGAVLLVNEFARAFVDVNREPGELDGKLISDLAASNFSTARVKAGLGVIPRTVGDGVTIYKHRMSQSEALHRINEVHAPWHTAIETQLEQTVCSHGTAILVDCHSMPSNAAGNPSFDIILGDRFGASCAPSIMFEASRCLRGAGLTVGRNNPYAGGYTTERHGHPVKNQHAIQIEINRSLYMIEGALTLRPSFSAVRETMSNLVSCFIELSISMGRT